MGWGKKRLPTDRAPFTIIGQNHMHGGFNTLRCTFGSMLPRDWDSTIIVGTQIQL